MRNKRYARSIPPVKRPVLYLSDQEFAAETKARKRAQREPLLPVRVDGEAFMRQLWRTRASGKRAVVADQRHGRLFGLRHGASGRRVVQSGRPALVAGLERTDKQRRRRSIGR